MKYPYLILLLLFLGCKEKLVKHDLTKGEHVVNDSSVWVGSPHWVEYVPDNNRYFFFSYMLSADFTDKDIVGDDWFSCNGFPSKHIIDSLIHTQLRYEKKCYSDIIITQIFEFKSKEDYDSFNGNNKPAKVYKHKLKCPIDNTIHFSPFQKDTTIYFYSDTLKQIQPNQ